MARGGPLLATRIWVRLPPLSSSPLTLESGKPPIARGNCGRASEKPEHPVKRVCYTVGGGGTLTDTDWSPMGIALQADTALGEEPGGLQAPYVTRINGRYHMFYGDWNRICLATSPDGIRFERVIRNGSPALFGNPEETNTRDAMVLQKDSLFYAYYTAHPNQIGAVYLRTSPDLRTWSASTRVAYGGQAGDDKFWLAECPFVVEHPSGYYYLFRIQSYGRVVNGITEKAQKTSVYRSKNLYDFGVEDDQYFVGTMEVAAPEIFRYQGEWYMAALLPDLQGVRLARLRWVPVD